MFLWMKPLSWQFLSSCRIRRPNIHVVLSENTPPHFCSFSSRVSPRYSTISIISGSLTPLQCMRGIPIWPCITCRKDAQLSTLREFTRSSLILGCTLATHFSVSLMLRTSMISLELVSLRVLTLSNLPRISSSSSLYSIPIIISQFGCGSEPLGVGLSRWAWVSEPLGALAVGLFMVGRLPMLVEECSPVLVDIIFKQMNPNAENSKRMIEEDLEESEILNQRFLELLNSRHAHEPSSENHGAPFQITLEEEHEIKERFKIMAGGRDSINYAEFRDSLGLLGREDSFIRRIFRLIDCEGEGEISEEDYLRYIHTVIHGSEFERQLFGWKIFSGGRDELQLKDLSSLFEEISILWNALTGEIVQPKAKYIEELFSILDVDQDDVITFQDYRVFYKVQPIIFGWFEYLNNIDINDKIKTEMEKTKSLLQVNNFSITQSSKTANEVKTLLETQERIVDSKMSVLMGSIKEAIEVGYQKAAYSQILKSTQESMPPKESQKSWSVDQESSLSSLTFFGKYFTHEASIASTSDMDVRYEEEMSRLKRRKQKIQVQENNDINREMVKELEDIMEKCYKAMNACGEYRELKQLSQKYSPSKLRLKEAKMMAIHNHSNDEEEKGRKKNIQVYFGHPNWNLVLNLMVGLRKSIRSLYNANGLFELKSSHFAEQHEFLLGSKALNGKSKEVYKFIEIAPVVFEKLRLSFGISNLEYQKSVGPETLLTSLVMGNLTALNEKCSTGKSGSFFYLTQDSNIFLKTIPKHEFIFFTTILQNYYKHQRDYINTLIVRIYGLYKLKIYENKEKVDTIYFISMENIFKDLNKDAHKSIRIKEIFDLKGSLYGRSGEEGKELKDNDWIERNRKVHLPREIKEIFINQIRIDSKYFKHNNINDYSLMVTLGEVDVEFWSKHKSQGEKGKNVFKSFMGGIFGDNPGEFYILSIIDILTVFGMKKNFEYAFKSTFLSKDVSCIPPAEYCKRFRQFMWDAVEEDADSRTQQSE